LVGGEFDAQQFAEFLMEHDYLGALRRDMEAAAKETEQQVRRFDTGIAASIISESIGQGASIGADNGKSIWLPNFQAQIASEWQIARMRLDTQAGEFAKAEY
jgi:hypothetical protein